MAHLPAQSPSPVLRSGIVEGFYGSPWTHTERIAAIRFAALVGMGEYMYAPKNDPFHRDRWMDPYPTHALQELAELAAAAHEVGVKFTYAISPGLTMRFSEESHHGLLAAKAEQLWQVGVTSFALLFDDVPMALNEPADEVTFGTGQEGVGMAHGHACTEFLDGWWRSKQNDAYLVMCPTDYAGCDPSPYRQGLAKTLPEDARVMWTGRDIVVGEISREDVDRAWMSYGRRLILWDNFPCNDFDRTRLFLGPLVGRPGDVDGSALEGILSNPMVEAVPSRFSLVSVAQWAEDPAGYQPDRAAESALKMVAGPDAALIAPLVQACSSWPPSAPQDQGLSALVTRVLSGDSVAQRKLERRLAALADQSSSATMRQPRTPLLEALAPWLMAAQAVASSGLAACAVLKAESRSEPVGELVDQAELVLINSEQHFHNVLRGVIFPFVREVLDTRRAELEVHQRGATAWLVTAEGHEEETRGWCQLLESQGLSVELRPHVPTAVNGAELPELIVLTPRADQKDGVALKEWPVPVLANAHQEALGIASRSGTAMDCASLNVVAIGHPMASGFSGHVQVHRGPGRFSWVEPAPGGTVIARQRGDDAAVLTHHARESEATTGTQLPAARVGLFLTVDGPAPWLLTDAGRVLCEAAIQALLSEESTAVSARSEPLSSASGSGRMDM